MKGIAVVPGKPDLMADRNNALGTLSNEELGTSLEKLGGSARGAAVSLYILFCVGTIVPVFRCSSPKDGRRSSRALWRA